MRLRVRELAEKAQLPTTMTLMALGMLPKAHPLSLGMLGMHGVRSTNYIFAGGGFVDCARCAF